MPKSTTLDDLKRLLRTLFQETCVFGAHHENLNEDRPILSEARCSAMILVSGDIKFMGIFAATLHSGTGQHFLSADFD